MKRVAIEKCVAEKEVKKMDKVKLQGYVAEW